MPGTALRTAFGRCRTGITVVAIIRKGVVIAAPDGDFVLRTGDLVMVAGDGAPVRAAAAVLTAPGDERHLLTLVSGR